MNSQQANKLQQFAKQNFTDRTNSPIRLTFGIIISDSEIDAISTQLNNIGFPNEILTPKTDDNIINKIATNLSKPVISLLHIQSQLDHDLVQILQTYRNEAEIDNVAVIDLQLPSVTPHPRTQLCLVSSNYNLINSYSDFIIDLNS